MTVDVALAAGVWARDHEPVLHLLGRQEAHQIQVEVRVVEVVEAGDRRERSVEVVAPRVAFHGRAARVGVVAPVPVVASEQNVTSCAITLDSGRHEGAPAVAGLLVEDTAHLTLNGHFRSTLLAHVVEEAPVVHEDEAFPDRKAVVVVTRRSDPARRVGFRGVEKGADARVEAREEVDEDELVFDDVVELSGGEVEGLAEIALSLEGNGEGAVGVLDVDEVRSHLDGRRAGEPAPLGIGRDPALDVVVVEEVSDLIRTGQVVSDFGPPKEVLRRSVGCRENEGAQKNEGGGTIQH